MSTINAYVLTLSTLTQYISLTINFISLIIGTIGGICNLITFTAPQLRRNSCVFYLLCANIFQLISILFILPTSMAVNSFGDNLERQSIIFCKIRYYLVVSLPELATYYLLLSIMDRCLATCNSVRMRAWSELKVAHRLSVAVFFLGLVSNAHLLVFYTIYKNNCQIMPDRNYTVIISVYALVAVILLPYTLMLILCVITFMNMKRTKRRVIPLSNTLNRQQKHRFEYHIVKVIILQVVVSSVLLLLRVGSYVYLTLTSGNLNMTIEERAAEGFSVQLGVSLYFFSFAVSFYSSTLTSKYFRDIFWKRITEFYRRCCGQL